MTAITSSRPSQSRKPTDYTTATTRFGISQIRQKFESSCKLKDKDRVVDAYVYDYGGLKLSLKVSVKILDEVVYPRLKAAAIGLLNLLNIVEVSLPGSISSLNTHIITHGY